MAMPIMSTHQSTALSPTTAPFVAGRVVLSCMVLSCVVLSCDIATNPITCAHKDEAAD
jgi:hypothetical protein